MVGAVDIGATKIAVGIVDGSGHVVEKSQCLTDAPNGFDHAIRQVSAMLSHCMQQAGTSLRGIGIGSTGQVDVFTGKVGNINNLPGWEGNPVEVLSQEFGVSVAIENDADAAALGELYWGTNVRPSRVVVVMIGTGIGVSVIIDGKVYRGARHSHPEIGHHVIDTSGPTCSCGVQGCWEILAAGPSLPIWMRANAPEAYWQLSARRICELAAEGDEFAIRGVERQAKFLGLGLANVVTMFAPETIILGGSVMKNSGLFLDPILRVISRNCKLVPHEPLDVRLASLGPDVVLIGAAQVWHHRFERCGGQVA